MPGKLSYDDLLTEVKRLRTENAVLRDGGSGMGPRHLLTMIMIAATMIRDPNGMDLDPNNHFAKDGCADIDSRASLAWEAYQRVTSGAVKV